MITYVVQPGDTIYTVANKFGSTVSAIVEANNIIDPDVLFTGQVLRIPVEGEDVYQGPIPRPGPEETVYVVQPGDTLTLIAGKFGTSVQAIVKRNNIADPNFILPGQVLIIPLRAAGPPEQPPRPPAPPVGRRIASRMIDGLQYILYTNKFIYDRGEPIKITLVKRNTTTQRTFLLEYPSSKKYDFVIRYEQEVVWRWSKGKIFTPAVQRKRLGPGENLIYRETWDQEIDGQEAKPGVYRLIGWNTATPNVRLVVQFRIT